MAGRAICAAVGASVEQEAGLADLAVGETGADTAVASAGQTDRSAAAIQTSIGLISAILTTASAEDDEAAGAGEAARRGASGAICGAGDAEVVLEIGCRAAGAGGAHGAGASRGANVANNDYLRHLQIRASAHGVGGVSESETHAPPTVRLEELRRYHEIIRRVHRQSLRSSGVAADNYVEIICLPRAACPVVEHSADPDSKFIDSGGKASHRDGQ